MDRVIAIEPEPWVLKADGWVAAQYDIPETPGILPPTAGQSCPFACCWKSPCNPADGWRPMPDQPCAAKKT
jgi:hypothetical protein